MGGLKDCGISLARWSYSCEANLHFPLYQIMQPRVQEQNSTPALRPCAPATGHPMMGGITPKRPGESRYVCTDKKKKAPTMNSHSLPHQTFHELSRIFKGAGSVRLALDTQGRGIAEPGRVAVDCGLHGSCQQASHDSAFAAMTALSLSRFSISRAALAFRHPYPLL